MYLLYKGEYAVSLNFFFFFFFFWEKNIAFQLREAFKINLKYISNI